MSFLARFENKISTVTMHGTLRRADGSEEVRSGPMRKKPQPKPILQDNNKEHHVSELKEERNEPIPITRKHPSPRIETFPSPKKQTESPIKSLKKAIKVETQPSPVNRNEVKAVNEGDQLAFSKKARPVQYEPCTLSEYKQEKHDKYYELGKLKPDLNAAELVEKRANQERIKEFSKNLRQINQNIPKKAAVEVITEKKPSNREKALAFAKQKVPKPKHVTRKQSSPSPDLSQSSKKHTIQELDPAQTHEEDLDIHSELYQLQLKHKAARAQVEALMRD